MFARQSAMICIRQNAILLLLLAKFSLGKLLELNLCNKTYIRERGREGERERGREGERHISWNGK